MDSDPKSTASSQPRLFDFLQKAGLILFTGIVIPIALTILSYPVERIQKSLDAERVRQEASLQSKYKLWEDVSETLITYYTLALDVSWFGGQMANKDIQQKTFERYNMRVADLFTKWRILSSRARTLASQKVADDLNAALIDAQNNVDTPTIELTNNEGTVDDWNEQHSRTQNQLKAATALIGKLADDMGLRTAASSEESRSEKKRKARER